MHYGVTMFMTDLTMRPDDFAREVEAHGLHSMYLPEHTHIPVSRRTPPPTGDAELRDEYKRTLDPFVALAMAAAVTDTILVGTGICLVAQREPIVTAKAVATLDQLSGGRFVLGIGFGWNEDEIGQHGVTMPERRDVTREHMLAMRALWNDDEAEFHGARVDFAPSWSWPKPTRRGDLGGPPVLIGGAAGPKLFAHIAEYADGWIPIGGRGIREALPELHAACEAAGRDPESLRIVPFGTIPDAGKLEYYASLGIEEIVLRVPSGTTDEVLPLLDRYADLAAQPA
ncbi:MAG TPA: LLM class F420-dependent oxidoreductase [Acidimicrobiia bacterium]|jgi:probable F420-dependent oxidoreductase